MKKVFVLLITISSLLIACSGGDGISADDYNTAVSEAARIQKQLITAESENESLSSELESVQTDIKHLEESLKDISEEYEEYKKAMAEYENLSSAEAKAREIEAAAIIESKEKADEESRAAEQAEREAKEKAGYDTGISYMQLARNPDDFVKQKVCFKGEILQVMEGDQENQIRLAVHKNEYGWYDSNEVIYCGYDPSIISFRLLEKDIITIYGTAAGLYSYEAVSGATITLPAVWIDMIELNE